LFSTRNRGDALLSARIQQSPNKLCVATTLMGPF
jgi:hypothetical protein